MSGQHTPGPWERVSSADWDGAHVIDARVRIVAECHGCDIPGALGDVGVDEAKANAYLIAAAPELLAALEGLLADPYLSHSINNDRMAPARAAIAKAKGGA